MRREISTAALLSAAFLCLLGRAIAQLPDKTRCPEGVWWGPGVVGEDTLLIAARYEEDIAWMALYLPGIMPFVIYNKKDRATHYTPVRQGMEASPYLQFLVDYYDCLPRHMAFIHAHQVDADARKEEDMKLIQWDDMPGYAALNRAGFLWHIHLRQHVRHLNKNEYHHKAANEIAIAWEEIFESELGPLPESIHVQGGGQFIVHRDRVRMHSRKFYQDCLQWINDNAELAAWDKGMVFEYVWKIIFGEAAETLDANVWDADVEYWQQT